MDRQFRRKVWLGVGIIALSIAIFSGLFWWLSRRVVADANKADTSQEAISSYARAVALLAELKSRSGEVENYQKELEALLPTKDGLIGFPKWLEQQARIRNVGLNFSFQSGAMVNPAAETAGSAAFSLDARGGYEQLKSFFDAVEVSSSQFVVLFDSLDVNLDENEYRVSAGGRVFFK